MRISRKRRRPAPSIGKNYHANEQIRAAQVRVVSDEGDLGIMPVAAAFRLAQERELDLVEINPKADPPVCKLVNFGHFKYQKEKEDRKRKVHAHETEVKGIRLSMRIGDHDMEIRKQQGLKFLQRGDKLKIELIMRGRERIHKDIGEQVIKNFIAALTKDLPIRIDQPISAQGHKMFAVVARS